MKFKMLVAGLIMGLAAFAARAQAPEESGEKDEQKSESDVAVAKMVEKAEELISLKEYERGISMLENVLNQYPRNPIRFKVFLLLGRHLISTQKYNEAIRHLRSLNVLETEKEITPGEKEMLLEARYLTGVAYFHMRQYGNSFAILRGITRDYPNSVWANQAYYYIGMCHFALKNWSKAIEALTMVGTFIDPDSPTAQYAEAERRFYVKISDADAPILFQMGKDMKVELETRSGDRESINCVPISSKAEMAVGSIPTATGAAKPGNGRLEIIGGDTVTVRYIDGVDFEGNANVARTTNILVVSSGQPEFTLGTYDEPAVAAYIGQPVFVRVDDLDRDTSPNKDMLPVKIVSRYEKEPGDESAFRGISMASLVEDEDSDKFEVRDEIALQLTELATNAPYHSSRFGAAFAIKAHVEGISPDKADGVLECALGDEIVVTYSDDLTIEGPGRKDRTAKIRVSGAIDGRPMITQNVVSDPVVKAKKDLVEASAFLELTRIFRSMGLMKKAIEKANDGLQRLDGIIISKNPLPTQLKESAFKTKWELYIEIEDYQSAIATCAVFNRLYPGSSYADEALMRIGKAKVESGNINEGISIFQKVLSLPNSTARAEAQFSIAEALFAEADKGADANAPGYTKRHSGAMQQYKICVDRYPDSPFAGESIGRLVDYYVEIKDYVQADDLLNQIFVEYPDAEFLPKMLLKWVIVSFQMGNYEQAIEKCNQLIFDHPESEFAEQAKKVLPKLQQKTGKATTEGAQ